MREWIDLLAISTRFDFQRIRECAIDAIENSRWEPAWRRHLNNIDPIEQILLAEKHDIPRWLRIAYVKICERSNALEEWEAEKIGARKTALLARARETVRNPHKLTPSPPPPVPPEQEWSPRSSGQSTPEPAQSNSFFHNRHRVDFIVSEVFFPSKK
jgi:hypothetical protein